MHRNRADRYAGAGSRAERSPHAIYDVSDGWDARAVAHNDKRLTRTLGINGLENSLLGDLLWRARQFACQALHIKTRPLDKRDSKRAQLIERLMRCLKYAVLATVLFIVYMGYAEVIDEGSPWVAFAQLASLSTRRLIVVSVALLVLIVVGSLVRERFFCRCICPMGAVFSLLPCMPWARMHRNDSTCPARCQCCHNACPMGTAPKEDIAADECVMCGRCQQACPRSNIRYGIGPKKDAGCWSAVVLVLSLALLALL